jgi:hypothetical protein
MHQTHAAAATGPRHRRMNIPGSSPVHPYHLNDSQPLTVPDKLRETFSQWRAKTRLPAPDLVVLDLSLWDLARLREFEFRWARGRPKGRLQRSPVTVQALDLGRRASKPQAPRPFRFRPAIGLACPPAPQDGGLRERQLHLLPLPRPGARPAAARGAQLPAQRDQDAGPGAAAGATGGTGERRAGAGLTGSESLCAPCLARNGGVDAAAPRASMLQVGQSPDAGCRRCSAGCAAPPPPTPPPAQSTKVVIHTALPFVHDASTGVGLRHTLRFGRVQFLKQLNSAVRWAARGGGSVVFEAKRAAWGAGARCVRATGRATTTARHSCMVWAR